MICETTLYIDIYACLFYLSRPDGSAHLRPQPSWLL